MSPIGLSHNSQSEIVAHVNSNNHHNNQYENHPLHPYFVLASIQHGQKKVGSALAPQKMLAFCSFPVSQQIDPSLEKEAVEVDEVRIEANKISPIFRPITVAATNLKLHNSIYEAGIAQIQHNQLPKFLVIGGDHSMAIGSITSLSNLMVKVIEQKIPVSFSKSELIVFWIDAHADINTPSTTSSGNLHGCPVSLLTNMDQTGWNQLPSFDWRKEKLQSVGSGRSDFIQPSRICYIGLRAVDPEEQVTLDQHHILEYPMTKVKEYNRNMKTIVREALNRLDPDGLHPIHISLDIDGIDPFYAASTGTPVPDGLFPLECKEIINELQNTGRLVSMDLAEVNLELGTEEDVIKTRDTAAMLLDTFVSNL